MESISCCKRTKHSHFLGPEAYLIGYVSVSDWIQISVPITEFPRRKYLVLLLVAKFAAQIFFLARFLYKDN